MDAVSYKTLSEEALGCAFRVHNGLGPGLPEAVYEEAFCVELKFSGIPFERQKRFPVRYRGIVIGEYIADLVVDGKVLLELKVVKQLTDAMSAQTVDYLKISGLKFGYLMNFHGCRLAYRRFINSPYG